MNRDAWMEEVNYAQDRRVTVRDGTKPVIVELEDDEGNIVEHELPTCWGVCDLCGGEGKHVDPSIDASGLTAEDFHEDPDFARDYMRGVYDVQCNRCHGRTTVRVVDEAACDPKLLEAYHDHLQAEADFRREQMAELRMGA